MSNHTRVLIAGGGPTGLTLALELARRGVPFRLVDAAPEPFRGSRGKGLQPRTLEIFEDLDILPQVLALGGPYPSFRAHAFRLSVPAGRISRTRAPAPDVPYPNIWMMPQWRTEQLLRARLAELGGCVEFGVTLADFVQDERGVRATLVGEGGTEAVHCEYLVGCDGGHSRVRKVLGVRLEGEALEAQPVIVADVTVEGIDRTHWHVWPLAKGAMIALCPLVGTPDHQLAAPLRKGTPIPELSEDGIRRFLAAAIGGERLRLTRLGWVSLYRPHVRMVDRFRIGRVFLAGDAAHVHPPTGGQGLNTSIQDAYNLGWKLAGVLAGAPDALLDSYEAERLPIAAHVLGLSKRLQLSGSARRGPETQQLELSYRDGPLARDTRREPGVVRAGDRAPDAPCAASNGEPRRLFDEFRGTHWTLLLFDPGARPEYTRTLASWAGTLRIVTIASDRRPGSTATLFDEAGHARRAYGAPTNGSVLVRPDGHIAHFATSDASQDIERYLSNIAAPA